MGTDRKHAPRKALPAYVLHVPFLRRRGAEISHHQYTPEID